MQEGPPVAVVVPLRESVPSEFMTCLMQLQLPRGSTVITTRRIPLDAARNFLVSEALRVKAEWLLWLDSDMTFPRDIFYRLTDARHVFSAAPYPLRREDHPPSVSVAGGWDGAAGFVDAVGFGCVLTHHSLFEGPAPWFDFTKARDPENGVGEDVFFCRKVAAEMDVRPWTLAREESVGHLLMEERRL